MAADPNPRKASQGGLFPGLQRPGLIEGTTYNGGSAPWSRGFPGLQRPGLIEGTSTQESSNTLDYGFRGFNAPASLKVIGLDSLMQSIGSVSGASTPWPH